MFALSLDFKNESSLCGLGNFVLYILRFTKHIQMVGNLQFLNTKYIQKCINNVYPYINAKSY